MSWFVVFCELCDTLCIGHENDPVLKLRWLCSFFSPHILDAFENFDRRVPHVNLPHEFNWFSKLLPHQDDRTESLNTNTFELNCLAILLSSNE